MKNQLKDIINQLKTLPTELFADIIISINEIAAARNNSEPLPCPHCNGKAIKHGHKDGKQRFLCKVCGKTFVETTNTIMRYSHYDKSVWETMLEDTLDGNALSYSEKRLGISHDTAFHMRHKILCAIEQTAAEEHNNLSGVCELDDTFVLESYKGKALPENFWRKARKHGAKAVKRGISNEYVCICAGIQRDSSEGLSAFAKATNRAKPSGQEIADAFTDVIADGTLVLTDGHKSYRQLEAVIDCQVKDTTIETASFYNLNSINGLHSFIKQRYTFYRGVATKFLNRYSALFEVAYRYQNKYRSKISSTLLNALRISRYQTIKQVAGFGLVSI